MPKNIWLPVSVCLSLITLGLLMAYTDLFQPLITFIHSKDITPFQAIGCILGALVGFYIVFHLLVRLGAYFLPDE
ncbi:hypothetical protein [Desulforhopalus sp. 52FAK]